MASSKSTQKKTATAAESAATSGDKEEKSKDTTETQVNAPNPTVNGGEEAKNNEKEAEAEAEAKPSDEIEAEAKPSEKASADEDNAAAALPPIDYEKLFAHRGPYEEQKSLFGPSPDYSQSDAWYWCGADGSSGPEIVPAGIDKPEAAKRAADCFYIHPSSYYGDLWNMPLSNKDYQDCTDFYLTTEASAFNGCCRLYCPKFRQAVVPAMGHAEEGRVSTDLGYSDVKAAFEVFLRDHNKGRPLVLASHSQGSLYLIRLLQDFVEGKPLLKNVVAIYGIAAWAPLSMFEGSSAVFKEIGLCKAADSTGCFISWTLEHPDTVAQHVQCISEGKNGDWFPQMGHRCGTEWRIAHGEPIVGTNPLTWSSNGLGGGTADKWLGMLQMFAKNLTWEKGPVNDMDTLVSLIMSPNTGLKVNALARVDPDEVQKMQEKDSKAAFAVKVAKSGDLEMVPLPTKICGSEAYSYEHMNFIMFYFNIRNNLEVRLKAFLNAKTESGGDAAKSDDVTETEIE